MREETFLGKEVDRVLGGLKAIPRFLMLRPFGDDGHSQCFNVEIGRSGERPIQLLEQSVRRLKKAMCPSGAHAAVSDARFSAQLRAHDWWMW